MMRTSQLSDFYKGKKVLVTGGAGFIGSHLVDMLVESGAVVTVPVRKTTNLYNLKYAKNDISIVEADLSDRKSVDSAMKGQEIVISLAAAKLGGIAYSMRHHGSIFRDNMLSFINALDSARCESIKRFIVVSSACVYPRDSENPITEEEAFKEAPEPTNAGFGWSKLMQEYMALSFAEEYGMNVGIVRPFNAYGPRDNFFKEDSHVIPGLITRLFNGENPLKVWGTGNQTRSFLYASDCAAGILQMGMHTHVTGPVNIGSDEEITVRDLAKLILELSGINAEITFDTSKPDGQPRRSCDAKIAKETLNYRTTVSLREGLKKTIGWYKKELAARKIAV